MVVASQQHAKDRFKDRYFNNYSLKVQTSISTVINQEMATIVGTNVVWAL